MEDTKNSNSADYTTEAYKIAAILGGSGLLAGYIAPLILWQSNIGPVFGFVLSGPVSFGLGMLIGLLRTLYTPFQKIKYESFALFGSIICTLTTVLVVLALKK